MIDPLYTCSTSSSAASIPETGLSSESQQSSVSAGPLLVGSMLQPKIVMNINKPKTNELKMLQPPPSLSFDKNNTVGWCLHVQILRCM